MPQNRTKELIDLVSSHNPDCKSSLQKACSLAQKAHKGQTRASGEDYYTHPIEVAFILANTFIGANMKLDCATILTAILHDTVEDTNITLKEIKKQFGSEISDLVDGVTKLTQIQHKSESEKQAENFRKLFVAMSRDIRVLVVKLADRLHNMRTLSHIKSQEKVKAKALETMEIYAPLAERIGMQQIKNELQDLSFSFLYPEVRDSIINRLKHLKSEKGSPIDDIREALQKLLDKNKLRSEVVGREKTPYSIWQKMKRKDISFEQLSDVMAFRVIVDDTLNCYNSLGIIHSKYHAIPGTFKDYISTPKKNAYQSLHTVIIGPDNHKIEVQIRTKRMHIVAEFGLAGHWAFKEDIRIKSENDHEISYGIKNASLKYSIDNQSHYSWINELLSIFSHASSPEELLENTKLEMYYDQVFCFTPKGRVIALPKGASAIDFAYGVHSDVGNTCVGAKINGKVAPLRTKLQNGDQVEILTSKSHKPLPSWEKFVITGKALSEIRKVVKQEKRQEYINLGRLIVAQIIEVNDLSEDSEIITDFAKKYNKKSNEEFLVSLGNGTIPFETLVKSVNEAKKKKSSPSKQVQTTPILANKNNNKIPIKGLIPGMAVHLASCCHPIPGDRVVGITQAGKGITVHISDCETLQNYSDAPEKWLDLAWDKNDDSSSYIGTLDVLLLHQPGSLAILTRELEKYHANINNFKINNRSSDFFEITIDLEVKGINHLTNIIDSLKSQKCIHSVSRHIKS
ncbi:MAG: bifunctional (p)ppGpp synthetase/guanosine-3',5'-bis(diphosphate) 3'-pyrophosphohydrolase [Rickettsiales bacterium]